MAEWVTFIENALEEGKSVTIYCVGNDIHLEPHQTVEISTNEEYTKAFLNSPVQHPYRPSKSEIIKLEDCTKTRIYISATSTYEYESINKIKHHTEEHYIYERSIIGVSTSMNKWEEIK